MPELDDPSLAELLAHDLATIFVDTPLAPHAVEHGDALVRAHRRRGPARAMVLEDPGSRRALTRAIEVASGVRLPLVEGGLYGIVDVTPVVERDRVLTLAREIAEGGASLVQVRAKGMGDRATLDIVRAVVDLLAPLTVPVIVNDRPDIAHAAGAAGVHVGTDDLPLDVCRAILGPHAIVGRSGHSIADLDEGLASGAPSYLAFGPVFSSTTKVGHADVTGTNALESAAAHIPIPLVAIGGFTTPERAAVAVRKGAAFVAAVSAFASAASPRIDALRFAVAIAIARELAHD
jgi:thiamine-phosphate pyrophosphorylase